MTIPEDTAPRRGAGSPEEDRQRAQYWPVPVVRAVCAAIIAVIVTFSADHSARFGLLTFGAFALASGIVIAVGAARRLGPSGAQPYLVAQGAVSVILGGAALAVNQAGVAAFLLVITTWAVLTGGLELYSGIRTRRRYVAAADWRAVGAITLLAAVAVLLVPPEFAQEFTGPDDVLRVLDASIVVVGMFGAYAAIIAVYLFVAGFSAKWGTGAAPAAPTAAAKGELP